MGWFQISNYQTLPLKSGLWPWGEKLVSAICGRQIDTSQPKPKHNAGNCSVSSFTLHRLKFTHYQKKTKHLRHREQLLHCEFPLWAMNTGWQLPFCETHGPWRSCQRPVYSKLESKRERIVLYCHVTMRWECSSIVSTSIHPLKKANTHHKKKTTWMSPLVNVKPFLGK